ncbi:hypothetical protein [Clostridium manihotivorum]|nr:hypothetical protein [Clostridium manihotivorum]
MRKKFLKAIASVLFISMFLVPVVGNNVSIHGVTIAPMGLEPGPID